VKAPARRWPAAHGIHGPQTAGRREPEADLEAGIDQAWGVLEQVAKWIAHAEGKASLTLASAGVLGGVLFSFVNGRHLDVASMGAAGLSGGLILACGLCAAVALRPRVGQQAEPNLLYFRSIARRYPDSAAEYGEALKRLLNAPDLLADEIASQIWTNSRIAARKFRWANAGLGFLIVALPMLGLTCALLL
jgi:hypothetical protein